MRGITVGLQHIRNTDSEAAVLEQECFRRGDKCRAVCSEQARVACSLSPTVPWAVLVLEGWVLRESKATSAGVGAAPFSSRWPCAGWAAGELAAGIAARGVSASGRNKREFLSEFLCWCLSRLRLICVCGPRLYISKKTGICFLTIPTYLSCNS